MTPEQLLILNTLIDFLTKGGLVAVFALLSAALYLDKLVSGNRHKRLEDKLEEALDGWKAAATANESNADAIRDLAKVQQDTLDLVRDRLLPGGTGAPRRR